MDNGHALAAGAPTRPAAIRALRQWWIDTGWPGPANDDDLALMGQLTYTMTAIDPNTVLSDHVLTQPDVTLLFDPDSDAAFLFGPA
jgi:hypothetical protein